MSGPQDGSQRASIDNGNPNTLADAMLALAFGSLLQGQLPQVRRKVNAVTQGVGSYNVATLDVIRLPYSGRACTIIRATARGTGVTGELSVQAYGATPTGGQIAVSPNGQIVVLHTDNITDLDVVYLPERGDVIELIMPVVTSVLTIPTAISARGVVLLLEAEALEGTVTGKKIVLIPASTAVGSIAAGSAELDLAKATVKFLSTDAVTRARVKLLVIANEDLCTVLEADATTL